MPITIDGNGTIAGLSSGGIAANTITAATIASGQTFSLNGIAFPATQVASSDANTLDDYEEGTWTPQLFQGSTQITSPTAVDGLYVKVGKMLWLGVYFYKASGAPSASGDWEFRNLPYSLEPSQIGTSAAPTGYNAVNGSQSTQTARFQANSSSAVTLYGQYGAVSWTTSYVEFSFSGWFLTTS